MNKRMALTAFLAAMLVAGCSTVEQRPLNPPSAPDRYGAPVPGRSLDAGTFSERPCEAVTAAQLRSLDVGGSARLDPLPSGTPACVWGTPGLGREVSLTFVVDRDYLVDTYRSRSMYRVFEPLSIAGLPAVAQQTTPGALTCTVTTGVAVGQAVDVSATEFGTAPAPSCDTARRLAEAVVSNLPPAPQK